MKNHVTNRCGIHGRRLSAKQVKESTTKPERYIGVFNRLKSCQNYNSRMPFTPYHFGPAGLLGYIFRKWIDFPVFVLANIAVDLEVPLVSLMRLGWPYHRLCHTFLIGSVIGAACGLAAYGWLEVLNRAMKKIRIPYRTNFLKMIISGILGVWLHVLIDGIYHYDVKPFWPMKKNHLWRLLSQHQVKEICVICFVILIVLYVLSRVKTCRKTTDQIS